MSKETDERGLRICSGGTEPRARNLGPLHLDSFCLLRVVGQRRAGGVDRRRCGRQGCAQTDNHRLP